MTHLFPDIDDTSSSVRRALKGKHILITGTTGFLGKAVLEKLIRAVPEIGGIHLLVRGNSVRNRTRPSPSTPCAWTTWPSLPATVVAFRWCRCPPAT